MSQPNTVDNAPKVVRLTDVNIDDVAALLKCFGLTLVSVLANNAIPGSFWGDDEAGLIGAELFARSDTPLHSILHEACHWITCTPQRRASLHTDAADNQDEENATCYLQILLSDDIVGFGRARGLQDMDAWGYSFRLGSAALWFSQDAHAEREWLQRFGLIDADERVRYQVRSN